MSKHVTKFEEKHKKPTENLVATAEGYIGEMMGKGKNKQENGALIVTDSRVVFYRAGIFGEVIETIPIKNITSIERKSILGHRTIVIHTSNDELAFKTFDKDNETTLVEAIESGRNIDNPTTKQPASSPDATETLRKLSELKQSGILSDAEFETKKAEILARI